jgi:1,4-dihydroxy-2-naphthoate octaprenyltransferase
MKPLNYFLQITRPLNLLGGMLLYALGAGIAHYSGIKIEWVYYLLGQAWVSVLQFSAHLLNEYYNYEMNHANVNRAQFKDRDDAVQPDLVSKRNLLIVTFTCLAVLASLTVMTLVNQFPPSAYLLMAVGFMSAFFYSARPIQLEASGYGELTISILLAFLVPAFANLLQVGEIQRLILVTSFPLTLLHLALLLTFELANYANDIKFGKRTLMVRMGWQTGMNLHNALILGAYLTILAASFAGLPRILAFASLLSLPIGLYQIWQMRRIAAGGHPNWRALTVNGIATFGVTAYLLTFTCWIW